MPSEIQKRDVSDAELQQFIAGQSAYIFQQPAWSQVLQSLGFQVAYYCLVDGGRIVLAQPTARLKLGFFRLLYCGLPYGLAVGDLSRFGEFAALLPEAARRQGFDRLRFSHNFYDPPVELAGYQAQEHAQQVLHFGGRTEEQVWEGFKGRVRRDVRLAERRGVKVETAATAEDRRALFEMYGKTMVRNDSFMVWQAATIEKMWQLIIEPGQGEMLLARYEGQPLAGIATFYSGRRCFYFLGASSGEQRSLCPNDAVIWEGMRRAIAHGCDDFDFMISSNDDAALIEFKAKWGTTRYPFRFHEHDLRPLRCRLWDWSFQIARTPLGSRLVRLVKGS